MIFKIDVRKQSAPPMASCAGTRQQWKALSSVQWGPPRSSTSRLKDWIVRPCGPDERPVYSRPGKGPKINPFT